MLASDTDTLLVGQVKQENSRTSSEDMRIGVDLGGTKIEGIILSSDGKLEEKIALRLPDNTMNQFWKPS
jgi:activator of 2-hydroxyglutaryl-CoA dehydratase